MEFEEEVREFLIESHENLALLDQEIVRLEQRPEDPELIASAFRTIHTIKGTCGFFGFDLLGAITHVTENILSQVRSHQRPLTPELITLLLEAVDLVKSLLSRIEETGSEGTDDTQPLRKRLEAAFEAGIASTSDDQHHTTTPVFDEALNYEPEIPSPLPERLSSIQEAELGSESSALLTPLNRPVTLAAIVTSSPQSAMSENSVEGRPPVSASDDTVSTEVAERDHQIADSTIRVDVALLNRLMNLVGELVLARNQLLQETEEESSLLQQTSQRLNLITSELQEGMMKTRMQPIDSVWGKLPRVVRDLSARCGKRIHLVMEGGSTELDKTVLEAIKDPLTHIVRNSCDHGIELPDVRLGKGKNPEGKLLLRAYHEGGVVNIEISDDGAGIDTERVKAKAIERGLVSADQVAQMSTRDALQLIFKPGFSTAAQVTSISGRGVGMDVVKTNVEKIGGTVDVHNRVEGGTAIRIKIPLTLAIIPGLVVSLDRLLRRGRDSETCVIQKERFIVPQANLLELVRIEGAEIARRVEHVHGTPVFHHRGKLLPLVYLRRVLKQPEVPHVDGDRVINIVVLQAEQRQLGLVVDEIWDTQEIVVKPLGRQLKSLSCYVGATIMGDGRPALILDVAGLSRLAGLASPTRPALQQSDPAESQTVQKQMVLLFSAGPYTRIAAPLAFVDRLEDMRLSDIEQANGCPVLHYRNDILPLVSLGGDPMSAASGCAGERETVPIIVFVNGERRVGLAVDRVIDIVSERVEVRRRASDGSVLLGSAVIGGKVTDLLDLQAIVAIAGEDWLSPAATLIRKPKEVLLFDRASVARQLLMTYLTASGLLVHIATDTHDVKTIVEQRAIDIVLTSVDLSRVDKKELHNILAGDHSSRQPPIVELMDQALPNRASSDASKATVARSDRENLLALISRLTEAVDSSEMAAA